MLYKHHVEYSTFAATCFLDNSFLCCFIGWLHSIILCFLMQNVCLLPEILTYSFGVNHKFTIFAFQIIMEKSEHLIIEMLKKGENSAYRYLFNHHYPYLCHVASQYLHDDYLAETVVGDVIFHLWQTRATLDIHSSLRSYLVRSVCNKCIDGMKYRHENLSIETVEAADMHDLAHTLFDESGTPLGRLIEKELEEEIICAVNSLSEECRRVFVKNRFENKKYREIAAELGISINTVKYHMKHALDFLESRLGKYLLLITLLMTQN